MIAEEEEYDCDGLGNEIEIIVPSPSKCGVSCERSSNDCAKGREGDRCQEEECCDGRAVFIGN